ncbi:MAG: hypothetical protein HGA33_05145 [Candidatus Moranbacteria bacterium]|nr:hypothetical protein [Candidatus Moranbacteria bacterium]
MSNIKLRFSNQNDRLELWDGGKYPIATLNDEEFGDLLHQIKVFIGKQSPEFLRKRNIAESFIRRRSEWKKKKIQRYVAREMAKEEAIEKVIGFATKVKGFFRKTK